MRWPGFMPLQATTPSLRFPKQPDNCTATSICSTAHGLSERRQSPPSVICRDCCKLQLRCDEGHVHAQERRIREALHELETPGVDQHTWRCLAGAVEQSGSPGLRSLLGWQLYKVPNVSGAQGKRTARCHL